MPNWKAVVGIMMVGFSVSSVLCACEGPPTYVQRPNGCEGEDCKDPTSGSSSSGTPTGGGTSSSSSSSSSGGSSGTSSSSGSSGAPPPALPTTWKDQFAYTELAGNLAELTMKLTDYANGCAVDAKGDSKKNGVYLKVAAKKTGATKIEAGTYKVGGSGSYAEASENRLDATCGKQKTPATAGTLTIESVNAERVKGSYEMTFPDGVQKGTFDAALCDVPDGLKGACID
jgi:hypothetical protein